MHLQSHRHRSLMYPSSCGQLILSLSVNEENLSTFEVMAGMARDSQPTRPAAVTKICQRALSLTAVFEPPWHSSVSCVLSFSLSCALPKQVSLLNATLQVADHNQVLLHPTSQETMSHASKCLDRT